MTLYLLLKLPNNINAQKLQSIIAIVSHYIKNAYIVCYNAGLAHKGKH